MKLLLLVVIILSFNNAMPQNDTTKRGVLKFDNQGDREDYWTKNLFDKGCEKQQFRRYSGKVKIVNKDTFAYGGNILIVKSKNEELNEIFRLGIIYSSMFGGSVSRKDLNIDSVAKEQNAIYNFMRIDSLTISDVEELETSNSFSIKRFRFLLWRKGLANPMLHFFELTNDKANKKSSLLQFIRGSRLTFFKMYSILM